LLRYGFRALCPLDNEFPGGLHGRELAHAIYEGNLQMVKDCDLVLANVNSFRGPGVDDGTAFEIGAAAVLGKPIIAYRDDWKPMHERLGDADDEGWKFENFGNAINLMLEISIVAGGGALIRGSFAEAVYAAVAWRARQSHEKPVHI
jgi:nucleoside deoxyribosyltransferase